MTLDQQDPQDQFKTSYNKDDKGILVADPAQSVLEGVCECVSCRIPELYKITFFVCF